MSNHETGRIHWQEYHGMPPGYESRLAKPCDPDVTLSTGRVVTHTRMLSGAQDAQIVGSESGEMTPAEWDEYVNLRKTRGFEGASAT